MALKKGFFVLFFNNDFLRLLTWTLGTLLIAVLLVGELWIEVALILSDLNFTLLKIEINWLCILKITAHNQYETYATLEARAKSLTDANTAEEVLYFQKGKPIDIEKYLENTYGRVLCYKEMYKIAQEKKPVRTHLMDFMATVCF